MGICKKNCEKGLVNFKSSDIHSTVMRTLQKKKVFDFHTKNCDVAMYLMVQQWAPASSILQLTPTTRSYGVPSSYPIGGSGTPPTQT